MIQGFPFIKGSTNCLECDKKFRFILPQVAFFFWSGFCTECEALPLFMEIIMEMP